MLRYIFFIFIGAFIMGCIVRWIYPFFNKAKLTENKFMDKFLSWSNKKSKK